MRINQIAKVINERFSTRIKSSALADEIRAMPEFSHLKDKIKSHASSLEDSVAQRIIDIHAERSGEPDAKAAKQKAALEKAAEADRQEKIKLKRQQLKQKKVLEQEVQNKELQIARQRRDAEMERRLQATGGSAAPNLPPPAPLGVLQTGASRFGRIAPPVGEARPAPMARPPASPRADSPPAQQAVAPPQADPGPQPAAPPPPQARQTLPGQAPPPTVPPPASPSMPMGADGQPLPPPPPKLGTDSPFRMRPTLPARPGTLPRAVAHSAPAARTPPQERSRTRGAPGERGKSGALVIPEIGVMTLKTPSRRGRGGPKVPQQKKKGLKTIARDEIEFKPSKVYGLADEFRRPLGNKMRRPLRGERGPRGRGFRRSEPKITGPVRIGSMMTIAQFAESLRVPASEIIKKAFLMGQKLTINQLIEPDLAELIVHDYGFEVEMALESDDQDVEGYRPQPDESNLKPRPPVVTIMGHVDHGKTTLLDAYRSSRVVEQEHGGITQHIGAYYVVTPKGEIVFLDTPGHEAFTSMRARGASVTDLVVLVVSADDGVMPQTVEAIHHAREAQVPIIVAINKMDLPGADPQRVRNELMQHSLLSEELGGDTIFVEISAKQHTNLDQLLEMILLQAGVLELTADPSCRGEGIIIETHVDRLRGAVATVLVHEGTIHLGDVFVVGDQSGRVRGMIDDSGRQVKEAVPSHPVEVIGLSGSPNVSDLFVVMEEERLAREIAELRAHRRRRKEISAQAAPRHVTLEDLHEHVTRGVLKELKIVLKADVQGSLEAVGQSLLKLSNEEITVRILHQATGAPTESDVQLASASDAVVVGFNVRPGSAAATLAEREGIEIKTYRIIYELIEEFQSAIIGMLEKRYKEVQLGRVEIRKLFKVSRIGMIAGCMVLEGEVTRGGQVRLVRDGTVVYEGKIASLRRVKDDVARVASGFECGITLENFRDIKESDIIEVYKMEELPAELAATS